MTVGAERKESPAPIVLIPRGATTMNRSCAVLAVLVVAGCAKPGDSVTGVPVEPVAAAMKAPYESWYSHGEAYFRFREVERITGPLRFYVSHNDPQVQTWDHVIEPHQVGVRMNGGGNWVEAEFDLALVEHDEGFWFNAVVLDPSGAETFVVRAGALPFGRGYY